MTKLYSKAAKILSTMPHDQRMDRDQLLAMLKNKGAKPAEVEHAPPLEGRVLLGDAKMHFQSAVPKIYHTELGTDPDEGPTQYEDYSTPGGFDYQEHLLRLPTQLKSPSYKSPHFEGSQKNNLLAHFRTTTRKTADGRRLLHIEEVQSDWGQEGREKGFRQPPPKPDEAKIANLTAQLKTVMSKHIDTGHPYGYQKMMDDPEYGRLQDAIVDEQDPQGAALRRAEENLQSIMREKASIYNRLTDGGRHPQKARSLDGSFAHPEYKDAAERELVAGREVNRLRNNRTLPPYHPLVKDTSAWTDLALKHILHHAAASGHDGITIAPGKVHGERYGMHRVADRLIYNPTSQRLVAMKNGNSIYDGYHKAEELPGVIGKEHANALLSAEQNGAGTHQLDTRAEFGGEGFKQFYDNQLPKSLAKLAQQHDPSVKVGTYDSSNPGDFPTKSFQDLPTGQYAHLPITDQMRSSIKENGFPAFARGGDVGPAAITGYNWSSDAFRPEEFSSELKSSPYSSTLSQYTPSEIRKMQRDKKFEGFKLQGGKAFFGLKKGTDYAEEYGIEHPSLTKNETALVGVVNNDKSLRGVGSSLMNEAVKRGATALDAFAVPSDKHPKGFLPEFYKRFGFNEVGRVPFDPKYVTPEQFSEMKKAWSQDGWDEKRHPTPDVVVMARRARGGAVSGPMKINERFHNGGAERMMKRMAEGLIGAALKKVKK